MGTDVLSELKARGLMYQCTDEGALREHLRPPHARRLYCGFDPTADSLTIGNLVPMMVLAHFQRAGHTPVVVMGGGTGLIGDPSGKTAERTMMTPEVVASNVAKQRPIFERVLDFSRENRPIMTDNAEWLSRLSYIDVLRDVGKHFSVNMMIQKESVKARLESREHGISYTEFSYMILQSYDFLHLYRDLGVTLQVGGSDQWGNIVAGADLIRRVEASSHQGIEASSEDKSEVSRAHLAFGMTAPLVTKADGGKFGKTESGAIWLTKERTSPYAYYQFWLNAADADVIRFLKIFTFVPVTQIEEVQRSHGAAPEKREAQRLLAREATKILHGEEAMKHAEHAAAALFSGDIAHLDRETLGEVFANVPSTMHKREELAAHSTNAAADQPGLPLVDLLPLTSLCKSKREAREHLGAGAVSMNGKVVGVEDRLTVKDLLHGEVAVLRRGKKAWHVTRWE
ncbi:MAG TPA: tyrosine--tRNA ligase [Phycisphaerales bacterium]|nr:tyrosine--tRNA ligase [Phycisphaerales bacterium]